MKENEVIRAIDLALPSGNRMLSGKEVGMSAREKYHLDELDNAEGIVNVTIDVPVVTSSFILGMFSQSVQKLGVGNFFKKYHFKTSEDTMKNIEINVRYSATNDTALS